MTTIAIIGGGIAARSLLFALAKENIPHKILVFYSDTFAFPCSVHSTAIVAPRGISLGHSPLGDLLCQAFARFDRHVQEDAPSGVISVPQFTGARTKLEAFRKRYPQGALLRAAGAYGLSEELYLASESAYLVRPREYLDWLLTRAQSVLDLELVPEFVTEVDERRIRTNTGRDFLADQVIFTAGVNNSSWMPLLDERKKTKCVQGSYLEFNEVDFPESVSLTLEGDNLIYDRQQRRLLVGSTTLETRHVLAPLPELHGIYHRLCALMEESLPPLERAVVRVGLREKGSRREPFLLHNGPHLMMGGFYKNGYALGPHFAERALNLVHLNMRKNFVL